MFQHADLAEEDYSRAETPQYYSAPDVPADLDNFTGTFTHHALGNWTVYLNDSTGKLMMETCCGLVYELSPVTENIFVCYGTGIYWYKTRNISFELDEEGTAVSLTELDSAIPARFNRDLDWNNPPPPPNHCF